MQNPPNSLSCSPFPSDSLVAAPLPAQPTSSSTAVTHLRLPRDASEAAASEPQVYAALQEPHDGEACILDACTIGDGLPPAEDQGI
jgi:hypothetical protein